MTKTKGGSPGVQPLLELKGVSAGYNGQVVLSEVDLSIYPGDFIGVIGPNGGGKTTLLKVMLGLLSPRDGEVRYNFDVADQPYTRMGYLPQFTLFDRKFPITVLDVVLGGLVGKTGLMRSFSSKARGEAMASLQRMGIVALKNRPIGELSGGQLQRTFLARALVAHPAILLLDEPDTFVDATFAKSFYELLQHINQEVAVVLVSHDLGMISSQVKSIACVNYRLHYHGSGELTQEIMDSYHCPIELVAHGPVPHRVLRLHDEPGKKTTG